MHQISFAAASASDRDEAATIVEYALLIALIAIIAFVAVQSVGPPVSSAFSMASDGFTP